jgi:fucokinase
MIHSGGDSKRIPQYSAFGKLFSKVPRELPDGRYSTLFDEFVISLSGLPSRMKDGLVVASGDVLLLFNHNQLDLGRQGAVGISIKTPAEKGVNHGVYLNGDSSSVEEFLHKQPIEVLEAKGAVDRNGLVNIDTGLIWMDSDIVHRLFELIASGNVLDVAKYNQIVNEKIRLNFYGDFIIPLTRKASLDAYLREECEGEYGEELIGIRRRIWEALKGHTLHVQALSPAEFIHFGTTKEFSDLMCQIDREYDYLSWKRKVVSLERNGFKRDISLINACIDCRAVIGDRCFIEDSLINSGSVIGDGCILSGLDDSDCRIELKDNLVMHMLPVTTKQGQRGYVTRIYGVNDNPKLEMDDNRCTFLNRSFKEIVQGLNIEAGQLWNTKRKDLWNARLFAFHQDKCESMKYALKLQNLSSLDPVDIEDMLSQERYSLKESYEIADTTKILDCQNRVEDYLRSHSFIDRINNGEWLGEAKNIITNNRFRLGDRVAVILDEARMIGDRLIKTRLYKSISEICKEHPEMRVKGYTDNRWYDFEEYAFHELQMAIEETAVTFEDSNEKVFRKSVTVESPARVNFGGGWSDTPPYSIENGGTILNAAISLNGCLPIKATATLLEERVIRLVSEDLSISSDFNNLKELLDYHNPSDPTALHKAALAVTGIVGGDAEDIEGIYEKLGGGLQLTTSVDIPKGSGLGTSSILAGTAIKALNLLQNKQFVENALFDSVLRLEQMLTTGGGWQDQVGGLIPGIKLVTSRKGLPQIIEYSNLKISEETLKELNDRLILVYTGQRRLAKGILRDIMGKYIKNNPQIMECLTAIQRLAVMMKFELEKGNVDAFARLLNEHWQVSKSLDQGCTNTYIDQIIGVCEPYVDGVMICGAGGGGFLQMILKKNVQKEEMDNKLRNVFMDNGVGCWEAMIV